MGAAPSRFTPPPLTDAECSELFAREHEGVLMLSGNDSRIVRVNGFIDSVLMYRHEDLLGRGLWEIGGMSVVRSNRDAVARLRHYGHLRVGELPLMTSDHISLLFEFHCAGATADGNVIVRCCFRQFEAPAITQGAPADGVGLTQDDWSSDRLKLQQQSLSEIERARRYGRRLALLSIEIDRAQDIVERDQRVTDLALQSFATACAAGLRSGDSVMRVGDASFVALMPETGTHGALAAAERLRTVVSTMAVPTREGRSRAVTVSIGVAASRRGVISYEALRSRADGKLYAAKISGGNRVLA